MNNALEKILNGPNFFFCERFQTRMSKKVCIDRQNREPNGDIFDYVPDSFEGCKECKQGEEIKRLMIDDGLRPRGASDPAGRLAILNRKTTIINKQSKEETKMAIKKCSKCGEEKDLKEGFHKNKTMKDGYERYCKTCKSKIMKDYRDAKLAASGKTAKKLKRIKVERSSATAEALAAIAEEKAQDRIDKNDIMNTLSAAIDEVAALIEKRVMKRISERLA